MSVLLIPEPTTLIFLKLCVSGQFASLSIGIFVPVMHKHRPVITKRRAGVVRVGGGLAAESVE